MKSSLLRGTLAALALAATVSQLGAQSADATLYTRVEDGVIRAAIEIEVDVGAHIYHGPTKADLGHPDAVGQPTTVTFSGEGITWGDPWFPAPHAFDQSDVAGPGVFINAHEDELVLYAAGLLSDGATGDDVTAKLKGLVCNDRGCLPYRQTAESEGEGPDELFAAFPEEIVPKPAPTFEVPEPYYDTGEADATLYTRVEGGKVRAALEIEVTDGWHLYHTDLGHPKAIGVATELELGGAGIEWGAPVWPTPHELDQSAFGDGVFINSHEGTIVVYAEGVPGEGLEATGEGVWAKIVGQTCDDAVCINYEQLVVSEGEGPDAIWEGFGKSADESASGAATDGDSGDGEAAAAAGHGEEGSDDGDAPKEKPLGALLLEAVLWGFITLLMPCTYPMIPITISFFTKQAEARGGNVLPLSLTYGAGIILVFVLIGVLASQVIIPFAQHPVTNIVIGGLFLVFAFSLLGFFTLNPPKALMNFAGKASMKGGYVGVFMMGTCLVVTSFTCTAPFVGTMLARAATAGTGGLDIAAGTEAAFDWDHYVEAMWPVVASMSVFGLTMAVPFVFLSLVPGRINAMPKSGEWMNTLKVTLGFVELAAALKFISNTDLGWGWNVISRELFLAAWAVIFLLIALFLWGKFFTKGSKPRIGPGRAISGALALAFAIYCGWGMVGNRMDPIMSSVNPPYSGGRLFPIWYEFGGEWEMVKDDHERAKELALDEDKLVLVNFTGFT